MEKLSVSFQTYLTWFLVNFIVCLLPIVVSGLIANSFNDDIFLSYLAYTYTLIMTSLYVFQNNVGKSSPLFWFSVIFSTSVLCFFILYPNLLSEPLLDHIRVYKWKVVILALIITIIISLLLNMSAIKGQIEKTLTERKFNGAKETTGRFDDMYKELNKKK